MQLRYISTIHNQLSKPYVDMHLYSVIGVDENGINAQRFVDELNYIANYTDIKEVRVRINSEGGEVIAGVGIFSAIVNTNKAGKVTVNTYNDGVCASIAGVILLAGKNRYSKPYARTMIHGVGMLDDTNVTENDKAAMSVFTAMINEIFTDTTFKNKNYFTGLLSNGLDNWFNSKDGLKIGLITAIEPDEDAGPEAILNACNGNANQMRVKLSEYINKQKTTEPTMKKVFMKLGISETSTEENAVAKVEEIQKENTDLQQSVKDKDKEIEKLKGEANTANDAAAEEAVQGAINSGKFNKEKKAELLVTAKADLKGFKNMLGAMNVTAPKVADRLTGEDNVVVDQAKEKIKGKTFREIERMSGGEGILNTLRKDDRKTYTALYNAQYNTKHDENYFN